MKIPVMLSRIGCALLIAAGLSSCTFAKMLRYNNSGIEDYRIFPARELTPAKEAQPYRIDTESSVFSAARCDEINALADENDTVALLVVKGNRILFEEYYQGYDEESISFAFSASKAVNSILVGCAIMDGFLGSAQDRVVQYVPELEERGFGEVTLEHLLQMTSGSNYTESDSPFTIHPWYYYTDNLEKLILRQKMETAPGLEFEYKSGDTQLLGLILQRVLAPESITSYLQRRIWDPLGMENRALWSIDHEGGDGLEKNFCCLAACARDLARIGRLYLNRGVWNGEVIVPEDWVEISTRRDTSNGSSREYQYGWWFGHEDGNEYSASGHLGQYVYISPETGVVVVRLGKSRGGLKSLEWREFFRQLTYEAAG